MEKLRKFLMLCFATLAVVFVSCQANTDSGNVVIAAVPVISVQPVSGQIVSTVGSYELTVAATVTDGGELTYQWYKKNSSGSFVAIEGATAVTLTVTETGTYKVIVTNTKDGAVSSTDSSEAIVTTDYDPNAVAPLPVIKNQPESGSLNEDDEFTFYVRVMIPENGVFSYVLKAFDDAENDYVVIEESEYDRSITEKPTRNPTHYVVEYTVYKAGLYKVEITNLYKGQTSVVESEVVEVAEYGNVPTADPVQPVITKQPESCEFDEDGNAKLSVLALVSDEGELTYQLYFEGELSGAPQTSGFFTVSEEGTYVIRVINTLNKKTSYIDSIFVTVSSKLAEKPEITLQPENGILSTSVPVLDLTVEAEVSDEGTITYQLYKDGEACGKEQNTGTFKVSEEGSYFVRIYNTLGKSKVYTDTKTAVISTEIIRAALPEISSNIASATYIEGDTESDGGVVTWNASVTYDVVDEYNLEGELTYIWYSNTEESTSGFNRKAVGAGATFTPSTNSVGELYYWCEVTNEAETADAGYRTASDATKIVKVTVNEVVVEEPVIADQPKDGDLSAKFIVLTVNVNAPAKGILSYQWYVLNAEGEFEPIDNQNKYFCMTETAGIYKVIITNTYRNKTATVTSAEARITEEAITSVALPVFSINPVSKLDYIRGDTAIPLTVSASAKAVSDSKEVDAKTLSYQWYINTTASTSDGNEIPGATESTYTPNVSEAGTFYYYVKATSENNQATGTQVREAYSTIATITVSLPVTNVASPVISVQPISNAIDYIVTDTAEALTVTASSSASGTTVLEGSLTYQWYRSETNSFADAEIISEAVNASYVPDITVVGSAYYFVVITATNNEATGTKSASIISAIVRIRVSDTNVASPVISVNPATKEDYEECDEAIPLTVNASAAANGKFVLEGIISYQWYSNTSASITDGTLIDGATTSYYTPDVSEVGTTYYYVIATATNNDATGTKSASAYSTIAKITVNPQHIDVTNVATPEFSVNPLSKTDYTAGDEAIPLTVSAASTGSGSLLLSGTVSYQWYSNEENSINGGTLIEGATNSSYTPDVSSAGTTYYYVVATATNNDATGSKTASSTSSIAVITVASAPLTSVALPVFQTQPASKVDYIPGESVTELTVLANALADESDSTILAGTVSYQWYSNTSNSTIGGTMIDGATTTSYSPDVSEVGTTYYYVMATATNNDATGTKSKVAPSSVAVVTVNPTDVASPAIVTNPLSKTNYTAGDTAFALTVEASASASGKFILEGALSYQWYSNTVNSSANGTAIAGATLTSYTPDVSQAGTTYYYVIATATNNAASRVKTNTVVSSVAEITVAESPLTNVASPIFEVQPVSGNYLTSDTVVPLTVSAVATANGSQILAGTVTYDWYKSVTNSTSSGVKVATGASYTPDISVEGTLYYYVIATATNNDATGTKTASNVSEVAAIQVGTPADIPNFTTNLSTTVNTTATEYILSVVAEGNGTIQYTLYKDDVAAVGPQSSGSFTVTEDGDYYIEASNIKGSSIQTANSTTCAVRFQSSGGITFQF